MRFLLPRSDRGQTFIYARVAITFGVLTGPADNLALAVEVSANNVIVATADGKTSGGESGDTDKDARVLPRVDVIGSGTRATIESSGSATVIDGRTLEESRVFNVNEALRKVPGVHVREEEGVGLRPNIGIRGLNPTRSTKTLLLEDGLPLSFAPYGDNASYYHPPIDRYESIEVSKGSQVIRFGPQTAGGVVNYITPEPQKEFGGLVGFAAGTRGYLNAHVMATGNGAIVDLYRKESDGARDNMHSRLDDLNFKWAGQLNDDHKLVLRATYFKEHSQLTYSGLTQAEYVNLGPRYNPFKNDFFDANRTGLSATHEIRLSADTKVLTSVYGAYFDRDWWRQASTTTDCDPGSTRASGTVLTPNQLNGCQVDGRLRKYSTLGIDSRVSHRHSTFGIDNQLEYGIKLHNEIQDRKQLRYLNYSNFLAGDTSGVTHVQEDQQRKTQAMSTFLTNRFQINDQFSITPIVRVEHITHQRTLRQTATATSNEASFTEFIPGISATFAIDQRNMIYGGIHKGFSPPRVEDALRTTSNSSNTASVQSVDLNSERSVNAELGLRSTPTDKIAIDITAFRNDFSNLVQVGSIAGGSTSYAEGKALFQGAEAAAQLDQISRSVEGNLFLRLSLTHLMTAEQRTLFSVVSPHSGGPYGAIGNRLPYAPKNLATITLGYRAPSNWNARAEYVYVGSQYSSFDNQVAPSDDGQRGLIDAYGIWNIVANYTVGSATLFVTAKNLTDQTYIVDRTRGIQVGMPRTIQAGIKYAF